jgi:hypothetical protein
MAKNKEIVVNLFKENYSPYNISIKTGIGIKEVYHYLKQSEEVQNKYKRAKENR